MAYVPVPKDLSKVKTKVAFGLTKRQLICFGAAALIGVPLFFLLKDTIPLTAAMFLMVLIMVPGFLFAMYERNGQPLEAILKNVITVRFRKPKERPYQTENFYLLLDKQQKLEKEVQSIVKKAEKGGKTGKAKTKAHPHR